MTGFFMKCNTGLEWVKDNDVPVIYKPADCSLNNGNDIMGTKYFYTGKM